jgi:hypothetical protein
MHTEINDSRFFEIAVVLWVALDGGRVRDTLPSS